MLYKMKMIEKAAFYRKLRVLSNNFKIEMKYFLRILFLVNTVKYKICIYSSYKHK